ncbi:enoyl-CoA hydratase-related protein [Balneatrix alpica]|uniref:Enoyl-CoA hydratase-related protein n=1 Tax=Balneatrix alpica TaxID=75684 RepID=A0ABV5ZFR6_9GAMM|nr:enoyl-CoA hydratase-related protein [Balneatrix alpica]
MAFAPNTPSLEDASLTISGGVALLTFERDDVRNALTGTALVDDLLAVLDWLKSEKSARVLIITGAGKAFSSGGNIKEMQQRSGSFAGHVQELEQRYRTGIQRMPLAMEACEVPIIAAINGPAIGAGFDLACMCDFRLGCPETLLGETFINLGIIPGDGGAWFLQRLIGYQHAAELTLSGRLVSAEEALQLGILLDVLPSQASLLERAQQMAQSFASKSPQALSYTKRLLKLAQRQNLNDFLQTCALMQGVCHQTAEHAEAVQAFIDKRVPDFTQS